MMEKEKALEMLKLIAPGDLIEVEFNGATGIARFNSYNGHTLLIDRWLDNPRKIRRGMTMLPQRLRSIADPDQPRVKRAIEAFKNM